MDEHAEIETRVPLMTHFKEFYYSIRLLIICIFVGAAVGYLLSGLVVEWLTYPFRHVMGSEAKLIYLSPFEKVWVHLRVSLWSGIFLIAPGIFYSIYQFVGPALLRRERREVIFMACTMYLVFWGGVFFARFYSVPLVLDALLKFKALEEVPFLGLSQYIDMTLGVVLSTALLFELPVVMFFLARLRWVTSQQWRSSRKMAILGNAVISAILSPPDAMSMIVLMIPIQLLFEFGIVAARMAEAFSSKRPTS